MEKKKTDWAFWFLVACYIFAWVFIIGYLAGINRADEEAPQVSATMTGKEMVVYILENDLEDAVIAINDGVLEDIVQPIDDVPEEINESIEFEVEEVEPEIEETYISEDDINLIALVTMAEAEGECEEGKRLVIDTILNRLDSEHFPDTVYDIIYQPNQFTSMWNGRTDRCEVREDIVQLVREELESRYNSECVFFRTSHYSQYGVPLFQVGSHYFSSYD